MQKAPLAEKLLAFMYPGPESRLHCVVADKLLFQPVTNEKSPTCGALFHLVPRAGVEPARPKALVFETNASTNSATWAIYPAAISRSIGIATWAGFLNWDAKMDKDF